MSVLRVPSLARCQFWGSPHLPDVSFEGPLTCWMSVLRVPSLAGCQFLEGPLTCLDVMWSLFWSKLDLKMKIWPTSGRFGENCLLKLVLVCPILTQWWNKKNWVYFPFYKLTNQPPSHLPCQLSLLLFLRKHFHLAFVLRRRLPGTETTPSFLPRHITSLLMPIILKLP